MPRGPLLSEEECAVILALFREGKRITNIESELGRSRSAVHRVIERGQVRRGARRGGPRRKLYGSACRLLIRNARTGQFSARILQKLYAPMLAVRRMQQLLADIPDLK